MSISKLKTYNNTNKILIQRPAWLNVVGFLILVRLLLLVPAVIGANVNLLSDGFVPGNGITDPHSLPGIWIRWDAGYYLKIANNGYSYHGEELAFFPVYPLFLRLITVFFADPGAVAWFGELVSNLAYIFAVLLLWFQVKSEYDEKIAWNTITTLSLFPTAFFFSSVYPESLFLFFAVLIYFFTRRQQYYLAAFIVVLVSLTRVNGIILGVIPLIELWANKPKNYKIKSIVIAGIEASGLGFYLIFLWFTQGSPIAFITVQSNWKRTFVWPWQTVFDSAGVALNGYGGFEANWFMRVTSAEDLLATLLFLICTGLAFFSVRKSLFIFLLLTMLLFLISHGPYTFGLWSVSRYVIILFPGFIILGQLLVKFPKFKLVIWVGSAFIMGFLTFWFCSGHWVA